MLLAWCDVLKLFERNTKLALIRLQSCGVFAHLLVFEVKGELTMPRLVQASSKFAHSWYQLPDIHGLCLHKEIRSMAQDKQNCQKHALCKWHC